jgi:hypothetical protein
MFRRLLISILLVLLPLQGFAAANLAHCLPFQSEAQLHTGHYELATDTDALPLRTAYHHDATVTDADLHRAGDHGSHHHRLACCDNIVTVSGGVSPAGFPAVFGSLSPAEYKSALPSVFLEGLKRPPRSFLI